MSKTIKYPQPNTSDSSQNLKIKCPEEIMRTASSTIHIFGKHVICDTDGIGYPTPKNKSPLELVVDASEGFIPLWEKNMTLRWRFQERSLAMMEDPEGVKEKVKELFAKALMKWGESAPVKFAENDNLWDFEIVIRDVDRCNINGCVLASAFFPDPGRHELVIYPQMFEQSEKEQVDTIIHELGHTFGLRHFFAKTDEAAWPSEIFGAHHPFTIMNYGAESELTEVDKNDLKALYESVWSGKLTEINGTRIHLMRPFHTIFAPLSNFEQRVRCPLAST